MENQGLGDRNLLCVSEELVCGTVRSVGEALAVLDIALDGTELLAAAEVLAAEMRGQAAVASALALARASAAPCPSVTAAEALMLHALNGWFGRTDGLRAQLCELAARLCRNASKADDIAELNRAHACELAAAGVSPPLATRQAAVLEAVISARALDVVEGVLAGLHALVCARQAPDAQSAALGLQLGALHLSRHRADARDAGGWRWHEDASTRGSALDAVVGAVAAGHAPPPRPAHRG